MARLTLSNEEKETLISFDETPTGAVIFTYNKRWQQHLEKRLGLQPTLNNGFGGREYHIPKNRIRPPMPPRKLSKETMERLKRQGKGLHKSPLKSHGGVQKGTAQPSRHPKVSEDT